MFSKCFQNALEPKHTLGISTTLNYVKGSIVLVITWITGHYHIPDGLNICSEYVFTGEHWKNLEANPEGPDQLNLYFNDPVFDVTCI